MASSSGADPALRNRAFGHSKFVPRVARDKFKAVVDASPNASIASKLWDEVRPALNVYAES